MQNLGKSPLALRSEVEAPATDCPRVCAVILTFNRVPMLRRCLSAVQQQTRQPDRVLVVDNHSSDDTPEYLRSAASINLLLEVLRTSENLGPAGGFATGMDWAAQRGYDYLWLLDDDSFPEPSCLEIQLAEMAGRQDAIIYPHNIDETESSSDYPAWRGPLVPRPVVERGGLPNKDLFWSKEDTEYFQWRLPRVYGVEVTHSAKAVARYYRANSMTRTRPAWKYYYWGRNTVYYRVWVQRPWKWWRYRKLAATLGKLWLRVAFLEDQKLKKARYLLLGTWHGFRGRLGKTVDPARS